MAVEPTTRDTIRRWPLSTAALVAIVLAVGGAILAALLTNSVPNGVTGRIETASAGSTTILGGLATRLSLGYAFGAGMVAAVNPCGFALLPAYLGLYLGEGAETAERRIGTRLGRALWVSGLVTLSFIALFGTVGVVLHLGAAALVTLFPWIGFLVGLVLILAGGRLLSGGDLYSSLGGKLADRLGGHARRRGSVGYFAYGLAYGLASLGCTLPIFLAVVGTTFAVDGFLAAAGQFALYGLGMGTILAGLTISTALFKGAVLRGLRRTGRYLHTFGAACLLLAGAYLIYYWLTLGGLLATLSR